MVAMETNITKHGLKKYMPVLEMVKLVNHVYIIKMQP
jgi:hypothetical protein